MMMSKDNNSQVSETQTFMDRISRLFGNFPETQLTITS